MKIKTDSSHKSFSIKSLNNSKIKRIAIKIGFVALMVGTLFVMSGCQSQNKEIMKINQDKNKEIIELYQAGELSSAKDIEYLKLSFAPIDNNFINELPESILSLHLEEDTYLSDLSELPKKCPYLEELYIYNCHSISNFDFIKDLKKLKTFKIKSGQIGVTLELINYLNENNITHNLTKEHIELNNKVESIAKSIITEDMTEEEKIQQISIYVMKNLEYDSEALLNYELAETYNSNALKHALEGKGVCINFAALTDALCQKAGLKSTIVKDLDHAWNMVCIEDKYYYIDVTNIDQIPYLSEILLKYFNIGFNYRNDPYATGLTAMSDIDNLMSVTPDNVIKLINEMNDKKTFIEKYGSNLYIDLIAAIGILIGIGAIIKIKKNKRR